MTASYAHIQDVLAAFELAAEANRKTPGRCGCAIAVTTEIADDVMITGDVHGHQENFERIRNIAALERHPRRHLVLQEACHGGPTYTETSGCMSHTILENIAALKNRYPEQVHFILGNHELAEMNDYAIQKNRQLLNLSFRLGLFEKYGDAAEDVRGAMMRFLWTCPLAVRLPQGVLIAHSLPDQTDRRGFDPSIFERELTPEACAEQTDVFRLLWGRDYRRENAAAFCELMDADILVTGHEPCPAGFAVPNDFQIILDCCNERAAYLTLPIGEKIAHRDIIRRIRRLFENDPPDADTLSAKPEQS